MTKEEIEEREYRWGYSDGWIEAANLMFDIWRLGKQHVYDVLFDHFEGGLWDWIHADCSKLITPPEAPISKKGNSHASNKGNPSRTLSAI